MNLEKLKTEQVNPLTTNIDTISVEAGLQLINQEDCQVPLLVKEQIIAISSLATAMITTLKQNGRIFYVGAGTSGRLAVLDAAECPPTYGLDEGIIIPIIAGGNAAMVSAIEGAEDDCLLGKQQLVNYSLTADDLVIGLAASGRTPFVIGAIEYGNEIGCVTGCICAVAASELGTIVNHPIEVEVGPEAITGSTRMKAGTAQKLVLNMLSTITMVKLGRVYNNEMVSLQATNQKLEKRSINIIKRILEIDEYQAVELLTAAEKDVKLAIIIGKLNCSLAQAKELLANAQGTLKAIPGIK